MTPEQREAATAIIYWRHRRPRDHARWGIQQDWVTGKRSVDMCLKTLRARRHIILYVVRGVEVRRNWQLCGSPIAVWKDERTGHWYHQPHAAPDTMIGMGVHERDRHPLSGEELAAIWRAEGVHPPPGSPRPAFKL